MIIKTNPKRNSVKIPKKYSLSIITTTILLAFIFRSQKNRKNIKESFVRLANTIYDESDVDIRGWKSMLFNANNFNFKLLFKKITDALKTTKNISRKRTREIATNFVDFFLLIENTLLSTLNDISEIKIFKSKSINYESKVREWIGEINNFRTKILKNTQEKAKLSSKPEFSNVIQSILATEVLNILDNSKIYHKSNKKLMKLKKITKGEKNEKKKSK